MDDRGTEEVACYEAGAFRCGVADDAGEADGVPEIAEAEDRGDDWRREIRWCGVQLARG